MLRLFFILSLCMIGCSSVNYYRAEQDDNLRKDYVDACFKVLTDSNVFGYSVARMASYCEESYENVDMEAFFDADTMQIVFKSKRHKPIEHLTR